MRLNPLLWLIVFCCACSAINARPPDVGLSDLRLKGVSLFETNLVATLRLKNENPDPLSVEGAAYQLYLNGIDVGRGVSDERISVPRLGSALQRVNFSLSNLALLTKIRSLIDSRDFSYRIEGRLYLPGALGFARSLPVSSAGRFDFAAPPAEDRR